MVIEPSQLPENLTLAQTSGSLGGHACVVGVTVIAAIIAKISVTSRACCETCDCKNVLVGIAVTYFFL